MERSGSVALCTARWPSAPRKPLVASCSVRGGFRSCTLRHGQGQEAQAPAWHARRQRVVLRQVKPGEEAAAVQVVLLVGGRRVCCCSSTLGRRRQSEPALQWHWLTRTCAQPDAAAWRADIRQVDGNQPTLRCKAAVHRADINKASLDAARDRETTRFPAGA
jgi:hypothetical protein